MNSSISITSNNSSLPINAPPTNTAPTVSIPASTSNSTDGSGSQERSTTTVSTSQTQMAGKHMAPPVKHVTITPFNKPTVVDPVLLKEQEIWYLYAYILCVPNLCLCLCLCMCVVCACMYMCVLMSVCV